jgi:hypothetical protein
VTAPALREEELRRRILWLEETLDEIADVCARYGNLDEIRAILGAQRVGAAERRHEESLKPVDDGDEAMERRRMRHV